MISDSSSDSHSNDREDRAGFDEHPTPGGSDWLDTVLREGLDEHVDEAGFTEKLMVQVPTKTSASSWNRPLMVSLGIAVGTVVTLLWAVNAGGIQLSPDASQLVSGITVRVPWEMGTIANVTGTALMALVPITCVALAAAASLWGWRQVARS